MSSWIIKAEGLGKRYRLQHQQQGRRYKALRDVLAEKAAGLFRRAGPARSGSDVSVSAFQPSSVSPVEDFWALRDVSFEIQPGEVVGIIGRNGAGKSTLLKVLSRITEPTEGQITLRGRVASLLEVGTGFHPELTGRENIFLNGAILGMSRAEIRRKFDEIVAFAEVERFLDTPVKRYSSGMYVRLAFAVAAHLEPEILVVDEVLAVGDAEFQKKCLGKMDVVAHEGRTVLFVSHNEGAIRRLCSRAVLLEKGAIALIGSPQEAFQRYRGFQQSIGFSDAHRTHSSKHLRITDAAIAVDGVTSDSIPPSAHPELTLRLKVFERISASFEVLLRDANSHPVMFGPVGLAQGYKREFSPGNYLISFQLKLPHLAEGRYSLDLMVVESGIQFYDYLEDAIIVNALPANNPNTGWRFNQSRGQGCILLQTTTPEVSEIVEGLVKSQEASAAQISNAQTAHES